MQLKQESRQAGEQMRTLNKLTPLAGGPICTVDQMFLQACLQHKENAVVDAIRKGADVNVVAAYPSMPAVTCGAVAHVLLGEMNANTQIPAMRDLHRQKTFRILSHLLRSGLDAAAHADITVHLIDAADGLNDIYPFLEMHGLCLPNSSAEHRTVCDALLTADFDALDDLVSRNVDLNQFDSNGSAPIHVAIRAKMRLPVSVLASSGNGRAEQWCDYLLHLADIGIDLSTPDNNNYSPLQIALETCQPDVAIGLVLAGQDPNEDYGMLSPLVIAATRCGLDTAKKLIMHGADPSSLHGIPRGLINNELQGFLNALKFFELSQHSQASIVPIH